MKRKENEVWWKPSVGGASGPSATLMVGRKYVGHFYRDADPSIDVDALLEELASRFNDRNTN